MLTRLARSAFGAVFLFTLVLPARAELNVALPLPVSPNVVVGKLPNGLTYYLQKNSRPLKKLELRLVVNAGSILEDEDQQGYAHLLEHMAFNGSTHFKKQELVSYLESIGVKYGADLNAYTSFDETVYILPIPTDKPANVDKGFQVLRDWAGGLTLNARDIDEERPVVLEELRLGKGANDRMSKVLLPKLYNGSRYAERLPIGKQAVIAKGSADAVRRYYRDWYRPNLMAVVVVGDMDTAQAERMVRKHFSDLKNPATERPRIEAPIAGRAATEALVITDKEANGNSLLIRYPVKPSTPSTTIGSYRADLVQDLFTSMLNARLQELSQLATPPFLGASSSVANLTARYEAYSAGATLGKGGAAPAIAALVQEHARASKFGFTAAELDRTKKNLLRRLERIYSEREKTESASLVDELVGNFLHSESIPGIENEYLYTRELVPGITLDEVNRYARETIPSDAPKLVAYMGSTNSETPTPDSAQLLAAFAAAEKLPVAAREEKALANGLLAQPPTPGKIVSEKEDKRLGLTTMMLSNGVNVILKPTDFRNDQVLLSAARHGGQSLYGDADIINSRYASAVAGAAGTGALSPLDLRKVLAGKAASVGSSLGAYNDTVGGSSGSTDVEAMLQLLYLKFTTVRRDPDLFQSWLGKLTESTRNALAQPEVVFQDAVTGALYNNNPRVPRIPRAEDLARLDMDRALGIYKERYSSAKGMTFIMVGSFDLASMRPLVATYLGSLPTGDLPLAYRDLGVDPVKGVVKKEVRSGADDKSRISISFTGESEFSEVHQMRLSALVDVMNIRIIEVLREKMALIYGGGLTGTIAKVPRPHYSISVALPTGPANIDKVIAATFAEIERMKKDGPKQSDLDKVKQIWLQNHQRAVRENGYWIGRLQASELYGIDPAIILNYEKDVKALTTADVKQAAQRYFNMANYVQVVLFPETKTLAPAPATMPGQR